MVFQIKAMLLCQLKIFLSPIKTQQAALPAQERRMAMAARHLLVLQASSRASSGAWTMTRTMINSPISIQFSTLTRYRRNEENLEVNVQESCGRFK